MGERLIIPKEYQSDFDDMSDARRRAVCQSRSGRQYRRGGPRGSLPFTAESVSHRLIEQIAGRYDDRPGGYTRLIRLSATRIGDRGQQAILQLVEQIARRQGLGDLLADGGRAAAERLGPEAEEMAIHAKGLEVPMHDPRAFVDMAVNYSTANRGGCHLEGLSYWRGYGLEW